MSWYYVANGVSLGPIAEPEMRNLRAQEVIAAETPVWTEGMAEWVPFQSSPLGTVAAATVTGSPVVTHTCVECGKSFPEDEMLSYEGSWVCAADKPIFFQRVKEGVLPKGQLRLATIGARWLAIIVDYFVIAITLVTFVVLPFLLISTWVVGAGGKTAGDQPWFTIPLMILWIGWPIFYEIFFVGKYGATPGKMLLKVEVVDATGARITYGRATGRFFAKLLSRLILYIGYLLAIWDEEKRTLHDRICDTRVISTRS